MEFLERQLAEATTESQSNAHASKCLHDMMEAGVIKQDNNGTIVVVNSEKEEQPFDPMNVGNLN